MYNNIRYYTCLVCRTEKEKILLNAKGIKAEDNLGNRIYRNTCSDCANTIKLAKPSKVFSARDPLHTCRQVECTECNKSVNKINVGYYGKNEAFIYTDELGRRWSGKRCPDCAQTYNKQYQAQLPKKQKEIKNCENCNKEFLASSMSQKFCSKECSRSANNKKHYNKTKIKLSKSCVTCSTEFATNKPNAKYCNKKCKPKPKVCYKPKFKIKKEYVKTCLKCNKEFKANRKNKEYCKPGHFPSNIAWRKKRKKEQRHYDRFKNPLSRIFKKDIIKIYKNKPDGTEVDHIIPRNHPDVCGLHVPWNLQYLKSEENRIKSNNWELEIILYPK